jgi:rhodanese-related sulfurtransferase
LYYYTTFDLLKLKTLSWGKSEPVYNQKNMNLEKIISENQGTIVDVRTNGEFMGAHVADSINIPLNEIPQRIAEFQQLITPVILCCASGNRSEQAQQFLSQHGIECYNGGSWLDINYYKSKTI